MIIFNLSKSIKEAIMIAGSCILIAIAFGLMFILVGCSSSSSKVEVTSTQGVKIVENSTPTQIVRPVVGLILPNLQHPFYAALVQEAEDIVPQQKGELFLVDGNNNPSVMKLGIEQLLSKPAAGLWIAPMEDPQIRAAMEKARALGLPVITIGKLPSGYTALTELLSDEEQGIGDAATMSCRALRNEGKLLILQPAGDIYVSRVSIYLEKMQKECPQVETTILKLEGTDTKTVQQAVSPYLTFESPYEGIFSPEDQAILAAIEVVKQHGLLGWMYIGMGDSSAAKASLNAEELSALIESQPNLFIRQASEVILHYQLQKEVAKRIVIPMNLSISDVGLNLPINPESKSLKVGLVLPNIATEFYRKVYFGARVTAHSLTGTKFMGIEAKNDAQKMAAGIRALVGKGVDGIMISAIDSVEVEEAIRDAINKRVRIYSFHHRLPNSLEPVIHIGSDERAIGLQAALFLCERLRKGGVEQPFIALVNENNRLLDLEYRQRAFNEGMLQYCPNSTVVKVIRVNGDLEEAEQTLKNNLKKERFQAAFADTVELGNLFMRVAEDVDAAQPIIIALGEPSTLKEGRLSAVISQNPREMGQIAMEKMLTDLYEKPVEKEVFFPVTIITKEMVGE